ncbi:hypothetical protein EDC01DRAFT_744009 [Geopyxis carbonaria]|nr:hypothetical protein EDC01DRAFT_744009 [Geopyxis carbonaria]
MSIAIGDMGGVEDILCGLGVFKGLSSSMVVTPRRRVCDLNNQNNIKTAKFPMSHSTPAMFIAAQRLASFKPSKRRSSATNSKIPPKLKWPHPELTPKSLADAGFFFAPSEDSPDNVTCFLCGKSLDGWESGDDPLAEHLRHSKDCGWAITATVMAQEEDFSFEPHGKIMTDARFKTFGTNMWPHAENLNLSIPKMVEAGFHFGPMKDSPDYAFCPYCQVSLAAWDPEDDPWTEHQDRAPDCPFIVSKPSKTKSKRSKRASEQNVPKLKTTLSKRTTRKKLDKDPTTESNEMPITQKSKRAGSYSTDEQSIAFEGLHETEKIHVPKRGRKRASSVLQDNFVAKENSPKRRQTRASVAPNSEILQTSTSSTKPKRDDTTVSYPENLSRKTTKASDFLVSSKKPRPYLPKDCDIDQILSLELDQPLSDEDCEEPVYQKPFIRQTKRTTRSRASMLMETQLKGTSENALTCTKNRQRSKTPLVDGESDTTPQDQIPISSFLKHQVGGSPLPIRIPKNLGGNIEIKEDVESEHDMAYDSPSESLPAKKSRGEPKKMLVNKPVKDAKPKRGRPAKKKGRIHSNSKTEDRQIINTQDDKLSLAAESDRDFLITHEDTHHQTPRSNRLSVTMKVLGTSPDHMKNSNTKKNHQSGEVYTGREFLSDTESVVRLDAEPPSSSTTHHIQSIMGTPASPRLEANGGKMSRLTPTEVVAARIGHNLTEVHASSENTFQSSVIQLNDDNHSKETTPCDRHQSPKITESDLDKKIVSFATTGDWEYTISDMDVQTNRKHAQVPLVSTPSTKERNILFTTAPWIPIDLNKILESSGQSTTVNGIGLSTPERDMTVEEWVAWSATNAEKRLNEAAEKIVVKFEEQGKIGIAALEGISAN